MTCNMAKKTTLYYYFRVRNGEPYDIKVTPIQINTSIMTMFWEMKDWQREFYLENPTATVREVWNCQLNPTYFPSTPDVQEYAADKVKELKDACYGSISVTSLEYAMAMDKTQNITADSYYTLQQATQVIKDFRSQSKHAMQVLNTYKPQIEEAQTIEAIDEIYQQAMEEL